MKKVFSLLAIFVLFNSAIAPIYAQTDTESDQQLADLLAEMDGSDAQEMGNDEAPEEVVPDEETVEDDTSGQEEHQVAEDILDMIETDSWSFATTKKTEVSDITDTSISVTTTAVLFDGTPVQKYIISYSENTIADLSNFEDIMIKEVSIDKSENDMVTVTLDGLTANTKYYLIVSPVHPTDPTADGFKMGSPEVTATTNEVTPTVTATTKVFENVSHTQDKNAITVTWDPTELVENGVIYIRHGDELNYTKVGTVSMISGKYTFTVNKPGSHFLKMHGIDNDGNVLGQEQVHNIKIEEFEQPEEPVQTAPQVGPTTDLIMMLFIFAFIVYFVYRFRKIER